MIGEAELLQRLRNREKNSIDEANDYEIKKENITLLIAATLTIGVTAVAATRKDFNVDRFICITC